MNRLPLLFVLALTACGAVGRASAPLAAYTLQPLAAVSGQGGTRHLVVGVPTTTGALATDRILIKPNPLQAEYLPKGRWVDAVPDLIRSLLISSLQNAGSYRLVSRDDAGLMPDFVVLVDVNDFQAEAPAPGSTQTLIKVGFSLSVLDEADHRLIATRRFNTTQMADGQDTLTLVAAFDVATRRVLAEAVSWVGKTTR